MKLIHCADIHLGSSIASQLKEKSQEKKQMVRNTFSKMVEYANNNNISHILLSGDVFDKNTPSLKDKKYFYSIVERYSNIQFYYLRGNHDTEISSNCEYDNLHLFEENWTSYEIDDVVISGIEINDKNAKSLYSTLQLNKDKKNIVMLHGQVSDSSGVDLINIKSLKNKNIDYLALGHIHSYSSNSLDSRGVYCYSGCLEPRGFDEVGPKGFVIIDVEEKITHEFVEFCQVKIVEKKVDISNCNSLYDIQEACIGQIDDKNNIYRLILTGKIDPLLNVNESDVESKLNDYCYFSRVKNKTSIKIDYNDYKDELSLKGEFIRVVYENEELSLEDKDVIASLGIRVLLGNEVEL